VTDIQVPAELWASSLLPEGVIEKWLLPDGACVKAGVPVALLRIEDALHDLIAADGGRLSHDRNEGSVVDPGMVIGRIV
jgi:hypothetical protein